MGFVKIGWLGRDVTREILTLGGDSMQEEATEGNSGGKRQNRRDRGNRF